MTVLPGQVLSHYRLVEKVGEGGMGVVWKAEDTVLRRPIAIKILPADRVADENRRAMFLREARAAAAIGDAHIVGIHEFAQDAGVDFIVMEFVDGRPLEKLIHGKPMAADTVAALGHQVAHAVAKAHRKGLLHRDLKPSNILVTPEGDAKVVDFGLATLFAPHDVHSTTDIPDIADASTLTDVAHPEPRPIAGTLPYMSPEQVRGEKLDARSDIFSFGAVLYEMTTGVRPFDAQGRAELAAQVQKGRIVPPHEIIPKIPLDLDRLILKAMAPKPQDRYQTMEDLAVDLKRLGRDLETGSSPSYEVLLPTPARGAPHTFRNVAIAAGAVLVLAIAVVVALRMDRGRAPVPNPVPFRKMVAVLPLENAAGDSNSEYLCDGITESIIDSLSRLDGLRVIARYTAFQYKGRRPDPAELRDKLGVAAFLTGRMVRRGGNIGVTVELIDTADGSLLWSEKYDRGPSEVFAIQDEISTQVAGNMGLALSPDDQSRVASQRTAAPRAHDLYLQGRYHLNEWGSEGARKALELFNESVEADPTYAPAWVGVAESYYWLSSLAIPAKEAIPKARAAARKALEIQDNLPEALSILAIITDRYDWDQSGEQAYRRAIALRPGNALVHNLYGQFLLYHGRQPEALPQLELAAELDPLSPYFATGPGFSFAFARPDQRNPSQAIERLEKVVKAFPEFSIAHANLGLAYLQTGNVDRAIALLEKGAALARGDFYPRVWLAYGYAVAGRRQEAVEARDKLLELRKSVHVSEYCIAVAYAAVGENERAMEWLEEAYQGRDESILYALVDPTMDRLREDPRFIGLLRRIGLDQ